MRMRKIRICEDANIHENVYGVQLRMDFRRNLKAKSGLSKTEVKGSLFIGLGDAKESANGTMTNAFEDALDGVMELHLRTHLEKLLNLHFEIYIKMHKKLHLSNSIKIELERALFIESEGTPKISH